MRGDLSKPRANSTATPPAPARQFRGHARSRSRLQRWNLRATRASPTPQELARTGVVSPRWRDFGRRRRARRRDVRVEAAEVRLAPSQVDRPRDGLRVDDDRELRVQVALEARLRNENLGERDGRPRVVYFLQRSNCRRRVLRLLLKTGPVERFRSAAFRSSGPAAPRSVRARTTRRRGSCGPLTGGFAPDTRHGPGNPTARPDSRESSGTGPPAGSVRARI